MQSIFVENPGSNYRLKVIHTETPRPTEYEVLIKVTSAGVNRADIFQAQGIYPPPEEASTILGLEVSGEIIAMGEKVKMHKLGDRVCALLAGGGYAEYAVAHESHALPIPKGVSDVDAAALPEVMFTCYLNLFELGKLSPGQTALIHGGASGVGTMAIQMARAMGIEVFATAGSAEKCEACEALGAKVAINYKTQDFVQVVKEKTQGKGVNLVLDMVGGSYVQKNLSVLSSKGILINIAMLEESKAEIKLSSLVMKNITMIGSTLRSKTLLEKHMIAQSLHTIFWPMLESGIIKPVVDSVFPFSRTNEAHQKMQSNVNIGKILLVPDDA